MSLTTCYAYLNPTSTSLKLTMNLPICYLCITIFLPIFAGIVKVIKKKKKENPTFFWGYGVTKSQKHLKMSPIQFSQMCCCTDINSD